MSQKRINKIIRKYSNAIIRVSSIHDQNADVLHSCLVEWWTHLCEERLGGPRLFNRALDSIFARVKRSAIARWGRSAGSAAYEDLEKTIWSVARLLIRLPATAPDLERLADEMAELVFLPAGGQLSKYPAIFRSVLPSVPPWAEIYQVRLTPSTLSQAWYSEGYCPVVLRNVIEAKVAIRTIDFERETILVISWVDRTESEFHFVMAASQKRPGETDS